MDNESFIIYYLNYPKAVELCMTLGNLIHTSSNYESYSGCNSSVAGSASGSLSAGNTVFGRAEVNSGFEQSIANSESYKVAETYEVKNTKSTYLKTLLKRARVLNSPGDIKACKKGELLKINKVNLKIDEDESTLGFQMLKREALKGMRVEGVDLNNLVSSILEDYSYVLTVAYDASSDGVGGEIRRIGIKIPSESTSEFESKYQIHDLQLGEVSLVGVYKGEVQYADLHQNMINSAQAFSSEFESEPISKVIKSAKYSLTQVEKNNSECLEGELLDYLDLIAIFQPACFEGQAFKESDSEKPNNENINTEKRGVFARIKRWLKGE